MKILDGALDPMLVEAALEQTLYRSDTHQVRVRDVIDLFLGAGIRVFITGGTPREWLIGRSGKDVDISIDRPMGQAHRLLLNAYPDAGIAHVLNERFGLLRWGEAGSGWLDINILRSWKDIQGDEMWGTAFISRTDLSEDALMRDFSVNAFYYDCRERSLLDPLGCGVVDLRTKALRLIAHRRVLDTSFRTTFRILQFMCRDYYATSNVLEYLECFADRDIQGMGPRIHRWIPSNFDAGSESMKRFKHLVYGHARQQASIDALDSFFN